MMEERKPVTELFFVGLTVFVLIFMIAVLVKATPHHLWLGDLVINPAYAHDESMAQNEEEARVLRFYKTWMRPPERSYSCCGNEDCHPVDVRRDRSGNWSFYDPVQGLWREIPKDKLESNAREPRESPDGRNHACYNTGYVFCAVLGSGQ